MKTEIKNLKKSASRIIKAAKNNERIIIYGDADLDGVSSVIILEDCLKNLGARSVEVYFPDREKEGYGINEKALKYLKKFVPALFISLDCGIGNFKEIKLANDFGFEVIVIDHHEILDKLPQASIIVDPKQKGDKYDFKGFATAGIAFRLARLLLGKKMSDNLRKNFLELTAMATIADMMPRIDDNEEMINEGLSSIVSTWRPGIQALLELEILKEQSLNQKIYKINSLLNIRDADNKLPISYRLLTISDKIKAAKTVAELLEKDVQRKQKIREIVEEINKRVSLEAETSIIFEKDSSWELVLLGVAASLLVKKYNKPVFLLKEGNKESQAGIRAPSNLNLVEAMKSCSQYFETYGGHPQAAGFRAKNENLEKVRECLIKYFNVSR